MISPKNFAEGQGPITKDTWINDTQGHRGNGWPSGTGSREGQARRRAATVALQERAGCMMNVRVFQDHRRLQGVPLLDQIIRVHWRRAACDVTPRYRRRTNQRCVNVMSCDRSHSKVVLSGVRSNDGSEDPFQGDSSFQRAQSGDGGGSKSRKLETRFRRVASRVR